MQNKEILPVLDGCGWKTFRALWRINGAEHITNRCVCPVAASRPQFAALTEVGRSAANCQLLALPSGIGRFRGAKKIHNFFCCGTRNCHKTLNTNPKLSPRPSETPPQGVLRKITYFPAFWLIFYFFFLFKIPLKIAVFG